MLAPRPALGAPGRGSPGCALDRGPGLVAALRLPRREDLEGGKPRPITPENTSRPVLIGDGRFVCALGPDFEWHLYPASGYGEPARAMGILAGEDPIRATPDGKWLYVRGADELRPGETLMTTRIYRVDPWTGRREL